MQKTINLNNRDITYTERISKKSKSIRLSIRHDGSVVVTHPRYVPKFIVYRFIKDRADWVIEKIDLYLKMNGGGFKSKVEKHDEYLKYKDEALGRVLIKLKYYNKFYNYKWNNVTIKNQNTRWGSCSRKGNLNFNYKIALLSEEESDYIVVHELCHLKEFNHGKKFWDLVALTIPKHKEIRNSLRNNTLKLF